MRVYGSKVSYYTGKLETYLRYKGIEYERFPTYPNERKIRENAGTLQMPAVERSDDRWMSDSTPILLQLEAEQPDPPILPGDEVVRFIALLLEDYADEWLWRPAMHYRWSYAHDRELLSRILADEQVTHRRLPHFVKRSMVKRRQRKGFVIGDGVRDQTRDHVEAGYFAALDNMSRMLATRPFLLGNAPSIADFGFMGPMLRHFGQDPTPADLMRERAPAVWEWVARVWNAKPPMGVPPFLGSIPEDAAPMLKEVCETHLHQLTVNADAFERGGGRFAMRVQGCEYVKLPVSRYRVACLEKLRASFAALTEPGRATVESLLPYPEAAILWDSSFATRSGYDEKNEAPFNRAINVYDEGIPQ